MTDPPPESGATAVLGESDAGVVQTLPASPSAHAKTVASELTAGTMVGDYRIEGKLGGGGMGEVYGAVHPLIGKRTAIKVLRAELSVNREQVERFVREARAVNQIGHPNIVDVFTFGTLPDGRSYFAMEWLQGESLRARVKHGRLTLAEIAAVVDGICAALDAAHDKGIVHRDLKPDNVFLVAVRGAPSMVKLLDFGIAKLLGDDEHGHQTRTGNLLGTPAYIAPEQARGEAIDQQVDVYSLGAMLFELLTGEVPFPARSAMDMISAHLNNPPPSPAARNAAVPAELDALVQRMMAKEAKDRPGLPEVRAVVARAASAPAARPATTGRRWLVPVVLASGVAAAAAAVIATSGGESRATAPVDAAVEPTVVAPVDAAPAAAVTPAPVDAAAAVTPAPVDAAPAADRTARRKKTRPDAGGAAAAKEPEPEPAVRAPDAAPAKKPPPPPDDDGLMEPE
jgi:serine/threonine-protein kinase